MSWDSGYDFLRMLQRTQAGVKFGIPACGIGAAHRCDRKVNLNLLGRRVFLPKSLLTLAVWFIDHVHR